MSAQTEITKIQRKASTIKNEARSTFEKLEEETRAALAEIKSSYSSIYEKVKKDIEKKESEIEAYFKSDEFLSVDGEQAQFDAEVRAELKYHAQYHPAERGDVVAVNQISWNAKKAAAALRQDPDKHLSVTPVAKNDRRMLQELVLRGSTTGEEKLLDDLEKLEDELYKVGSEIQAFDDRSEFYAIIF